MNRIVGNVQPVSRVMSRRPLVIESRAPAPLARGMAYTHDVHHLLVLRDGELVGVTCLCDLEHAKPTDSVARRMRAPALCIGVNDTTEQAALTMLQCGVGCLPVVDDDGVLVGIVTRRDLRRGGTLPGEPGLDRCGHCGTSHHLKPADGDGRPVLCFTCASALRPPLESGTFELAPVETVGRKPSSLRPGKPVTGGT